MSDTKLRLAIKDVLVGSLLDQHGNRNDNGIIDALNNRHLIVSAKELARWRDVLQQALEDSP